MLIRSAVAFGVSQIIVIGKSQLTTHGNQNTVKFMRFERFDNVQECREHLKSKGFEIIGVEIGENSADVTTHPFAPKTAFLFGNEGTGISPTAAAICDRFVFIPQFGMGTASLNVTVAASIVLHHFAQWAKYPTQSVEGEKFVVDEGKHLERHMFESSLSHAKQLAERKAKKKCCCKCGCFGSGCRRF